jgi:hypothetical protein
MAHLPPSYEDRCLRTWFVALDVQDSGDNPLHFCAHPRAHPLDCTCKCGVIEGVAITTAPSNRDESEVLAKGASSQWEV